MISSGVVAALLPVVSAGLTLAAAGVKKAAENKEVNIYIDRAKLFNDLFDPEKAEVAYGLLYQEILTILAKKGITPSVYWWDKKEQKGAPCISIPIATLKEMMDAATT